MHLEPQVGLWYPTRARRGTRRESGGSAKRGREVHTAAGERGRRGEPGFGSGLGDQSRDVEGAIGSSGAAGRLLAFSLTSGRALHCCVDVEFVPMVGSRSRMWKVLDPWRCSCTTSDMVWWGTLGLFRQ